MKHLIRMTMVALIAASAMGCPSQAELGGKGRACEFDEQCQKPLVCECVRRRSPDDEGPDEILSYGRCEAPGTRCPSDAGVFEAGPDTFVPDTTPQPDTGLDANEAAVEASPPDVTTDAASEVALDALDDGG